MNDKRCTFISPRGAVRCQLDDGHLGQHRAWDDDGTPTLVMNNKEAGA